MQQMQEQLQRQQAAMEQQSMEMERMRAQIAQESEKSEVLKKLATSVDRMATRSSAPSLVDTKGIGKPTNFGGGDEKELDRKFLVWQRKTANFIVAVFKDVEPCLEWSLDQKEQITGEKKGEKQIKR